MTDQLPHADAIWALSDGRAGMANQVIGLCERLAKTYGIDWAHKILSPSKIAKIWPTAIANTPARHLTNPAILDGPLPKMMIGCGRAMIPLLLHYRKQGVTTVYLQDPRISPNRFDLVIAPEHDPVTGPNVIKTLGSIHRVTQDRLETVPPTEHAEALLALPSPRVAVLIGGDNKYLALPPAYADQIVRQLRNVSSVNQASLMVTASRRTSDLSLKALTKGLAGSANCFFWDGAGDNPYFDMMRHADCFIVTEDSVNMASEAAATGKPVYILPLIRKRRAKGLLPPAKHIKFDHFHAALQAGGHAAPLPADGKLQTNAHSPLDPAAEALPVIKALLT